VVGQSRRTEEQLGHEPVIGNGRLVVGAVGEHLHGHSCSIAPRENVSMRRFAEIREYGAEEQEAEQVAEK